jgi:hypothetical protein
MAGDRTVSASELTDRDKEAVLFCDQISRAIKSLIPDPNASKDFYDKYGKVSYTRDAGAGLGAGKLQRDALCTRGKTGQIPLSNRNFRWHPLLVTAALPIHARPIDKISVVNEGGQKLLAFHVTLPNGSSEIFRAQNAHLLPETFAALPEHWEGVSAELRLFSKEDWSRNRCLIYALESCKVGEAVKTYLYLAISISLNVYDVDFQLMIKALAPIIDQINASFQTAISTPVLLSLEQSLRECPLCKKSYTEGLSEFRYEDRLITWQPTWTSSKRSEGEDASLQVMHMNPLREDFPNHNADNVRFGHRWCNIAMTDHSIEETVSFFEYVNSKHSGEK